MKLFFVFVVNVHLFTYFIARRSIASTGWHLVNGGTFNSASADLPLFMSKLLFDNLSPGLGDLPNQSANKFMELLLDFFLSRSLYFHCCLWTPSCSTVNTLIFLIKIPTTNTQRVYGVRKRSFSIPFALFFLFTWFSQSFRLIKRWGEGVDKQQSKKNIADGRNWRKKNNYDGGVNRLWTGQQTCFNFAPDSPPPTMFAYRENDGSCVPLEQMNV